LIGTGTRIALGGSGGGEVSEEVGEEDSAEPAVTGEGDAAAIVSAVVGDGKVWVSATIGEGAAAGEGTAAGESSVAAGEGVLATVAGICGEVSAATGVMVGSNFIGGEFGPGGGAGEV
jgi:hypothetical protein